ncbi:MAG: hypothetical protein IJ833_03290 [Lachnospiraceae bacterium]|nr:hypothetical protein [Lachnospiraceae bacterium]
MGKRIENLRRVMKGVLLIGFSVQIILGLLWMILNFPGSSMMTESLFCMKVNPVTVCIQYVLQVLLAFGAARFFLREWGVQDKKRNIWAALVLLTFPMAMQCHLSVGAESLLGSVLLIQVGVLLKLQKPGMEKREHKRAYANILLLSVLLIALGISAGMQEHGADYRGGRLGFASAMASRFAWSSLNETYNGWSEELKAVLPLSKTREITYYADNVYRVLLPTLEEAYGTEASGTRQVQEALWQLSKTALQGNTKGIVREISWDAAGYCLTPMVFLLQLVGKGYDSYSGILYDRMLQGTPRLSRLYMLYSCKWFCMAWIMTLLLGSVEGKADTADKRKALKRNLVSLLPLGILVVWCTFRGAGMMDYRKAIAVVWMWLAWMVKGVCGTDIKADRVRE